MQKDKQFYDNFYNIHPVNVHDSVDCFSAVSRLLFGNVLDVACGTGTLSDYYRGDYVGYDISDMAISKAVESRRNGTTFHCLDFTKYLTTPSILFDSVYLGEFLEHIEDDTIVFDNIFKLCRKNARVVVSVPNCES